MTPENIHGLSVTAAQIGAVWTPAGEPVRAAEQPKPLVGADRSTGEFSVRLRAA